MERHIFASVLKSSVPEQALGNLSAMANAMRRMANYLGLMEDAQEIEMEATSRAPEVRVRPSQPVRVSSQSVSLSSHSVAPVAAPLDAAYRIITLQPRSYNEARTIGEHYRAGNPVIINLDDMEEGERKRLVDFASGLVFGLHGTIERVSLKVFLLSPANVNVSTEDKTAAAQASFFNQS